jgi:hypothetical protein
VGFGEGGVGFLRIRRLFVTWRLLYIWGYDVVGRMGVSKF